MEKSAPTPDLIEWGIACPGMVREFSSGSFGSRRLIDASVHPRFETGAFD